MYWYTGIRGTCSSAGPAATGATNARLPSSQRGLRWPPRRLHEPARPTEVIPKAHRADTAYHGHLEDSPRVTEPMKRTVPSAMKGDWGRLERRAHSPHGSTKTYPDLLVVLVPENGGHDFGDYVALVPAIGGHIKKSNRSA